VFSTGCDSGSQEMTIETNYVQDALKEVLQDPSFNQISYSSCSYTRCSHFMQFMGRVMTDLSQCLTAFKGKTGCDQLWKSILLSVNQKK